MFQCLWQVLLLTAQFGRALQQLQLQVGNWKLRWCTRDLVDAINSDHHQNLVLKYLTKSNPVTAEPVIKLYEQTSLSLAVSQSQYTWPLKTGNCPKA